MTQRHPPVLRSLQPSSTALLRRMLMMMIVTITIVATAGAQPFGQRVSPMDPLVRTLDSSLRIQTAARIAPMTLVVWGTGRADSAEFQTGALAMRMLNGTTPLGTTTLLTSPEARPAGYVQAIAMRSSFLVLWNDRRAVDSGLYARFLLADGTPIGSEMRIGANVANAQTANGPMIVGDPRRGLCIAWRGAAPANVVWGVHVDPLTRTFGIARQLGTSITSLRTYHWWPYCALLATPDSGTYFIHDDGTVDARLVSPKFALPSYLSADTSFVAMSGDTLLKFASVFDAAPVSRIRISILDSLAPLDVEVNFDAQGIVRLGAFGISTKGPWGTYLTCREMSITPAGTVTHDTIFSSHLIGHVVLGDDSYEDIRFTRLERFSGCDNSAGVRIYYHNVSSYHGSTPAQSDGADIFSSDGLHGWINDGRAFTATCPRVFGPNCSRVADSLQSVVSVVVDTSRIAIAAPIEPYRERIPQITPHIARIGGALVVTWNALRLQCLTRWRPASNEPTTPVTTIMLRHFSATADTREFSVGEVYADIPGVAAVVSRDYQQIVTTVRPSPTVSGTHTSYDAWSRIYSADTAGWLRTLNDGYVKHTNFELDPNDAWWTFYQVVGADPNADDLLVASISMSNKGPTGADSVRELRPDGRVVWGMPLGRWYADTNALVPLGDRSFLHVSGTHADALDSTGVVRHYTLPTTQTRPFYQRLLGDRFARWYWSGPVTMMIEVFNLQCDPVATGTLSLSEVNAFPSLQQNPRDSSLHVLYSTPVGIAVASLTGNLTVRSQRLIARTEGPHGPPAGVILHDTLFAVWSETRSANADIFGIAAPVEASSSVNADGPIHNDDAYNNVEPEFAVNAVPNPVSDELTLAIRGAGTGVVTVELVTVYGDIIHSEEVSTTNGTMMNAGIDVHGLTSGTYFLRCRIPGRNVTRAVRVLR